MVLKIIIKKAIFSYKIKATLTKNIERVQFN